MDEFSIKTNASNIKTKDNKCVGVGEWGPHCRGDQPLRRTRTPNKISELSFHLTQQSHSLESPRGPKGKRRKTFAPLQHGPQQPRSGSSASLRTEPGTPGTPSMTIPQLQGQTLLATSKYKVMQFAAARRLLEGVMRATLVRRGMTRSISYAGHREARGGAMAVQTGGKEHKGGHS